VTLSTGDGESVGFATPYQPVVETFRLDATVLVRLAGRRRELLHRPAAVRADRDALDLLEAGGPFAHAKESGFAMRFKKLSGAASTACLAMAS
jgi:hypothetical protein